MNGHEELCPHQRISDRFVQLEIERLLMATLCDWSYSERCGAGSLAFCGLHSPRRYCEGINASDVRMLRPSSCFTNRRPGRVDTPLRTPVRCQETQEYGELPIIGTEI